MACDPASISRLAKLIVKGKVGETTAVSVLEDPTAKRPELGWLHPLRIFRHALGPEVRVKAIDPTLRQTTIAHNFVNRYRERFLKTYRDNDLADFWGIKNTGDDDKVTEVLKFIDRGGRYNPADVKGKYSEGIVNAALEVRKMFDELFDKTGIDPNRYIHGYSSLIKQRPRGLFRDLKGTVDEEDFLLRLSPEEMKFYPELERTGHLQKPETRLSVIFDRYVSALARAKILKPHIEKVEDEFINPYFGIRYVRTSDGKRHIYTNQAVGYNAWKNFTHTAFGGPTETDVIVGDQLRQLARRYGKDLSDESGLRLTHLLAQVTSSMFYSGAIGSPFGGRPSSIIQQLHSVVRSFGELGSVYTAKGLSEAMKFDSATIARLETAGLLSSPIEKLLEQVNIANKMGRVVSAGTDAFLKVFSSVDRLMRVSTALGSEAKFDAYQASGRLEKLSMQKDFKQEFLKLVNAGRLEEARTRYVFENVANLEYFYGNANRPEVFKGAIRGLLSVLSTFPLNTIELYRMFGERAIESIKTKGKEGDIMPLLRLFGATSALMWAGSEFMGFDMTNALMGGALNFMFPAFKMAGDTLEVGQTQARRAIGNIYGTGETQYMKMRREEAFKNFKRDFSTMLPGGVFFFNDIPRIVDGQVLSTLLGFQPVAEVRDEIAREKARERRDEKRFDR